MMDNYTLTSIKDYHLPKLQGSKKQVAWAIDIRRKYLIAALEVIADVTNFVIKEKNDIENSEYSIQQLDRMQSAYQRVIDGFLRQESAVFYIDNRAVTNAEFIEAIAPSLRTELEAIKKDEEFTEHIEQTIWLLTDRDAGEIDPTDPVQEDEPFNLRDWQTFEFEPGDKLYYRNSLSSIVDILGRSSLESCYSWHNRPFSFQGIVKVKEGRYLIVYQREEVGIGEFEESLEIVRCIEGRNDLIGLYKEVEGYISLAQKVKGVA